MYSKIYDFCSTKNIGGGHKNGIEQPPRVKWIVNLLKSNGIEFIIDEFEIPRFPNNKFYNIILPGSSGKFVTAHHDIVNPNSDNANDNSASVINAIMTKINSPSTTVILLDGEEPPMMGVGSQRSSEMIKAGEYGQCDWILNFELTGKGGHHFFIGNYDNELNNHIKGLFNCPVVQTPFNDAAIFLRNGITSTVINPLPPLEKKPGLFQRSFQEEILSYDGTPLDFSILYNCHSMKDSVDTIDPKDMQDFVESVVVKILA
jgi:hypothetical protein